MDLLPVEDALARILSGVIPLAAETVALDEAHGRFLADQLIAKRSQPPFNASAMDGYALRAEDAIVGRRTRVAGVSSAGHRFTGNLPAGGAVRIFTGAPVPEGADAILIQEHVRFIDDTTIEVLEPVSEGKHIRPIGLDFSSGDPLLASGTRLGFRDLALAAAAGHRALAVRRRPRVALVATGNELVPPGTDPGPDQIFSSNTPGIEALVRDVGGDPVDLGIVEDNRRAIAAAVEAAEAMEADVLVTLGGASVGDHDLVREALDASGMRLDFWRIAMRPGKPLMFGRLGELRVLGLPGNPVSALVCALLFLRPLVAAYLGLPYRDPSEAAVAAVDLPANDRRQDYVRATLREADEGPPRATPLAVQDSAMLSSLARADCLLIRAPDAPVARAGDPCRIIRLP